jgi:hypothetical protein
MRLIILGLVLAGVATTSPAQARIYAGPGVDPGVQLLAQRLQRPSRTEPVMRPIGTTRSPRQAVRYLRSLAKAEVGGFYNQCLRLADDAYMPKGPRVADAMTQWRRAKEAGLHHSKDPDPPIGAHMFWDPGHVSGHVATYVGRGKAATNMPDGTVGIVRWKDMKEWGPYLGWAPPYYR